MQLQDNNLFISNGVVCDSLRSICGCISFSILMNILVSFFFPMGQKNFLVFCLKIMNFTYGKDHDDF